MNSRYESEICASNALPSRSTSFLKVKPCAEAFFIIHLRGICASRSLSHPPPKFAWAPTNHLCSALARPLGGGQLRLSCLSAFVPSTALVRTHACVHLWRAREMRFR